MSTGQQLLTAREFEQMAFERPTELVQGEIKELEMPGRPHGVVCAAITILLGIWNRSAAWGKIFTNDSFVQTTRGPDSVRGPDVAFMRTDRLPDGRVTPESVEIPPDLVIEVLSPSDRWSEVYDKIEEYLSAGVCEVWIIDFEKRVLSIHQASLPPVRLRESDTLERPQLLPGFSCRIAELFTDL